MSEEEKVVTVQNLRFLGVITPGSFPLCVRFACIRVTYLPVLSLFILGLGMATHTQNRGCTYQGLERSIH